MLSSMYLGQPVQLDTAGGANTNPGYVISTDKML